MRSATEMLNCDDKFFCDHCCCLQEAQKRMLIKQAPPCLILHLKRFKYIESQGRQVASDGPCSHAEGRRCLRRFLGYRGASARS